MTFVHLGTGKGRNTVPKIREWERELEILFPTFGNGTGIRNTVPNILESEREWDMAANFSKYWENNPEI